MALNPPSQGFNFTPAYQTPGLPWLTSSFASGIVRHDFPFVAMSFTIKNNSTGTLSFAFTDNGFRTGNVIMLLPTEAFSAETRIRSLLVSGSAAAPYSVFATLTNIQSRMMPILTSSLALTGTLSEGSQVYWEGIG